MRTQLLPRLRALCVPSPHCPTQGASVIPSQPLHKARASPDCGVGRLTPQPQCYWGLGPSRALRAKVLPAGMGASHWAAAAPSGCICAGDTLLPPPHPAADPLKVVFPDPPAPSPRNFCPSSVTRVSCPLTVTLDFRLARDRPVSSPQRGPGAAVHKYLLISWLVDCWPGGLSALHPRVAASLCLPSPHSEGLTLADGVEFLTWKICSFCLLFFCTCKSQNLQRKRLSFLFFSLVLWEPRPHGLIN